MGAVVVGAAAGRPIHLRDIAAVEDGAGEPSQYVFHMEKSGSEAAVTLAISKRRGANAISVADAVLRKVELMRSSVAPAGVSIAVTRNYGETAAEKSNELLKHMGIAVISVGLLIALALGARAAGIVLIAIPVTLALTLLVFWLYGYTLNRITLFALIFSIGILVDDAIVVVENIARHARLPANLGRPLMPVAIEAVDEVGNPTILATLTVIAAILPMAFVGGLMGPYMRPIPVGATAAMIFSLLVAFVVTPWAAVRMLKSGGGHEAEREDWLTRVYRRLMGTLIGRGRNAFFFLLAVIVLLVGSMALFYAGFVKVKMLPFDNKSEFQVIIDLPEGTTLEETQRVTAALARRTLEQPEVVNVQTYAGTASPYNFNGLVRHYYLRRGANMADIQVNLLPKGERGAQSHDIAKQVRERLGPEAVRLGARVKVAEVPPGPPVLQTLVAEVYGPEQDGQKQVAAEVLKILDGTPGVVDADWYVEDEQPKLRLRPDRVKAALNGVSEHAIAQTVRLAVGGVAAGTLHLEREQEPVPVELRLAPASRSDPDRLRSLRVNGVPLSELTTVEETREERSIYHKNLMPVTYVTADVAGEIESPVYAMLKLGPRLQRYQPFGYPILQYVAEPPFDGSRYAIKWDGEWHVTYEVFRDLGLAFSAVMILIYVLVTGWFRNFTTPLVIMAAIPFSLAGILPAHGALNAFFTATSMIGFIAGAGIVVRNSIILVDFVELRLREGMALADAVVDAGAVRFRPMLLTAAAVVAGSAVILFDPIFQGLALSLMAGEIASLLLSRVTVPVVYYFVAKWRKMELTNQDLRPSQ